MAFHLAALTFDAMLMMSAIVAGVGFLFRSLIVHDDREGFDFCVGAGLLILVIGRIGFGVLQ